MKICFYYGSFDPFTNGHLYVCTEALKKFDKLVISIGCNPLKIYRRRRFNKHLMEKAMKEIFKKNNLNIELTSRFLITILKLRSVNPIIIRGIRNNADYIYEKRLSIIWNKLFGLKTIFIKGNNISSTMITNKLKAGEDVSSFLPKEIFEIVTTNSLRDS
ncbi:MAG: adenylyltransferase/cytidyltransferase family protein [Clostridia bacterium]|nr:adenylyltransferase/cytidyltransferase family protein [Clostridia bacterium]